MKRLRRRFYTAEQRWVVAFGRFMLNFINLESFYSTAIKSLDFGKSRIEHEWRDGVEKTILDPKLKDLHHENPLFGNERLRNGFANALASRSVRLAKQTVDSATLVFAHTLLDEALSDCCWISFTANPADWFSFVTNRKVELGQLGTQGKNDILKKYASEFVSQIERESMVKRLQHINQICFPRLKDEKAASAWLKFEDLESFDDLRHRIVHDAGFTRSIKKVEDQIYFAKQAGLAVLQFVYQAYHLKPEAGFESATERDALRFCVLLRREFPEMLELFEENLEAFRNSKRGVDIREVLTSLQNEENKPNG